ncbi:hypothetical protein [Acutalibacter sp.]|jgi:hypothetical protein|uniref:hypothetical protein n=1 Tax=Acutalibacter sp. TaxID=1918636 RepID=UPI002171229E|nr:hypothetical protein [Acutalibacter sp.]
MGTLGFSYVGLAFLLMLFVPNLLWVKAQPEGYSARREPALLRFLERAGQAGCTCAALCFQDLNLRPWSAWSLWLAGAFGLMLLYELWWVRYLKSPRRLEDFYSGLLGISLAGATLPVLAFLLLGVYGRLLWLVVPAALLGVGHIGVHLSHWRELKAQKKNP